MATSLSDRWVWVVTLVGPMNASGATKVSLQQPVAVGQSRTIKAFTSSRFRNINSEVWMPLAIRREGNTILLDVKSFVDMAVIELGYKK